MPRKSFTSKINMKSYLVLCVYMATILYINGCHGNITVSIGTVSTIPVVGGDITLVCSYSPLTRDRVVYWKDENESVLASHVCKPESACEKNVPNPHKYGLVVDDHSVSLTINDMTSADNGTYKCSVDTKIGGDLDAINVTVLNPVPPVSASISEDEVVTLTAGEPTNVTCTADGARPPATLDWLNTDNVQVDIGEQVDEVEGEIYVSRQTARVTPSNDDDDVTLSCQVLHPELERALQVAVLLNVQVPPASLQLSTSSGDLIREGSGIQTVTTIQGTLTSFECKSFGSRPAANISWTSSLPDIFPDTTSSVIPNPDDSSLNDTENILMITLERRHHGQTLHCWASVGNSRRDISVTLLVYGPPDLPELQGMTKLQAGEIASINCTANNGYPAPIIHWYLGSKNLTSESKNESTSGPGGRVRAESVLTFTPSKDHHGQEIICQVLQPALQPTWSRNASEFLNITYPPEIIQSHVRRHLNTNGSVEATFTCIADARPPASIFTWFYNKIRVDNETRNWTVHESAQKGETVTTSMLIILGAQETDNGKYECLAGTNFNESSAVINFVFSIPDPPSSFHVDITRTTSSSLFVAWQPGFIPKESMQTFTLRYCIQDNTPRGCNNSTNLNTTGYELKGLNPFTWYRLTVWAENEAGSSDIEETVASTSPLPPEQYGLTITFSEKERILHFSEAENYTYNHEICFIMVNTSAGMNCGSVDPKDCISPGSELRVPAGDKPVVVTSGRGLCSKPADIGEHVVLKESNVGINFIVILGVGSFAGVFAILISLIGLVHVCSASCSLTKKKDQPTDGSTSQTMPTQTVDDDGFINHPPSHETSSPLQSIPLDHLYLNADGQVRRNVEKGTTEPSTTASDSQELDHDMNTVYTEALNDSKSLSAPAPIPNGKSAILASLASDAMTRVQKKRKYSKGSTKEDLKQMDEDGLVYIEVSHDSANPSKSALIQKKEDTVYASLDSGAMEKLKEKSNTAKNSMATKDIQELSEDGLVYTTLDHGTTDPPKAEPLARGAPTLYASLDSDAMAKLKRKNSTE